MEGLGFRRRGRPGCTCGGRKSRRGPRLSSRKRRSQGARLSRSARAEASSSRGVPWPHRLPSPCKAVPCYAVKKILTMGVRHDRVPPGKLNSWAKKCYHQRSADTGLQGLNCAPQPYMGTMWVR